MPKSIVGRLRLNNNIYSAPREADRLPAAFFMLICENKNFLETFPKMLDFFKTW